MAGSIKGITISFQGDTTKLDKALRDINNNTRSLDKELKQVDNALKFNPTSVELWRQKQELLTQKINETRDKLDVLKQAQAQMDADGVDKNSQEYRNLQREIITTESKLSHFEGQLKQVGNARLTALSEEFKQVGSSLETAGQKMKGLSMAAAGVVTSLGAVAYKSGTAADDLNTLSKVTGISTGELQKYSYAADLVDVSVDAIAKSNKKLTRNAYEAANGSKTQAAAFDALGVSVTDSDGNLRDSDAIFQDVISSLGKMTNETERDALAQKIMGKSAAELNPLIEDGGETYKMVADTMKKYDLDYVDQETLDKANEFNDSIDTMKLLGSVAFAQVGSQLSAYLAPALEKMVDVVGRFAEWLSNLDPRVLAVVGAIAALVAAVAPMLIMFGKLATGISSIMSLASTLGVSIGALAGPVGIAIAVIGALIAAGILLYKNWGKIKRLAKDLQKNLKKIWENIKKAIVDAVDKIKSTVTTVWDSIKTTVTTITTSIKSAVTSAWDAIKKGVTNAVNTIKSVVTTVFDAIKAFIKTSLDGWKNIIDTAWAAIKKAVTDAVNAVKTVISTVFSAISTLVQTSLNGWKTIIETVWNAIKTVVTNAVNAVKTTVTTVFNAVKTAVSTAWDGIKSAITTPITNAKNTVATIVDAIKKKVNGAFDNLSGGVKKAFGAVKEAITEPIEKAKSIVDKAVGKIKGLFPIKLGKIFSGVKLPHFKISGGKAPWGIGGKGTKPSIDIDWYAKGGIFSSPSIIGVGEAGDEAVVPLDKFWDKLDKMQAGQNIVININGADKDPREIAAEVKRMLIKETNQRRLAWQ